MRKNSNKPNSNATSNFTSNEVENFNNSPYNCSDDDKPLLSIEEYRKLLNDKYSNNDQIEKRLKYLEAFCRNIIKSEMKNLSKRNHEYIKN